MHTPIKGLIYSEHGIDNNAQTLAVAKQAMARIAALHPDPSSMPPISFTSCASFDEWPRQKFDTVSMVDVMHHVPPASQMTFLDAARQQARDGGQILYKDVCRRPRWRTFANYAHDLLFSQQWIHVLPLEHVVEWGKCNGYIVTRREAYTKWWYGHELLVLHKTPALSSLHTSSLTEEN